jgi:hypothetical protein
MAAFLSREQTARKRIANSGENLIRNDWLPAANHEPGLNCGFRRLIRPTSPPLTAVFPTATGPGMNRVKTGVTRG